MKIRNPFKDYLCRFKDDATKTEKTVWTLVLIYVGVWVWTIDNFINGIQDWYDYLFPVFIMTITNPWLYKKKKK